MLYIFVALKSMWNWQRNLKLKFEGLYIYSLVFLYISQLFSIVSLNVNLFYLLLMKIDNIILALSLKKRSNIIPMLLIPIIMSSSFMIYFFLAYHWGSFPTV